jgi:hypothetical protein
MISVKKLKKSIFFANNDIITETKYRNEFILPRKSNKK